MTLRSLPLIKALDRPEGYHDSIHPAARDKWTAPVAAVADNGPSITIFDVIGSDPWTGGGFTATRMAGILRSLGPKPLSVEINSPGGDMFDGIAIYNMLKEHPAEVTVKVYGLAASAASVIAMAGDTVEMGAGAFIMIHNAWGAVIGNQNDQRNAADLFAQFDAAMADIYAARTGLAADKIAKMMDAETFIGAKDAIDMGFADSSFAESNPPSAKAELDPKIKARRTLDTLLARMSVTRSERRRLFREAGMQDATGTTTPSAGFDEDAVARLLSSMTSKRK